MITNRLHAGLDSIESPKNRYQGKTNATEAHAEKTRGLILKLCRNKESAGQFPMSSKTKGGADRNSDSLRLPDEVTSVECGPML